MVPREQDKTTFVKVMSNPRTDVITITPTRKKKKIHVETRIQSAVNPSLTKPACSYDILTSTLNPSQLTAIDKPLVTGSVLIIRDGGPKTAIAMRDGGPKTAIAMIPKQRSQPGYCQFGEV